MNSKTLEDTTNENLFELLLGNVSESTSAKRSQKVLLLCWLFGDAFLSFMDQC